MAEALGRFIREKDLRVRMGQAAREKARRDFRLDKQAEEVEAFYQRMLIAGKWNEGRD